MKNVIVFMTFFCLSMLINGCNSDNKLCYYAVTFDNSTNIDAYLVAHSSFKDSSLDASYYKISASTNDWYSIYWKSDYFKISEGAVYYYNMQKRHFEVFSDFKSNTCMLIYDFFLNQNVKNCFVSVGRNDGEKQIKFQYKSDTAPEKITANFSYDQNMRLLNQSIIGDGHILGQKIIRIEKLPDSIMLRLQKDAIWQKINTR